MKKYIYFACIIALSASTAPVHLEAMFDAFDTEGMGDFFGDGGGFGGGDDFDFGGMDFGSMDFGDDNNPFASLFGGGADNDEEFGSDFAGLEDEYGPREKGKAKDAPLPKDAASLEEAFKEGITPEVKKLSKQYKDALTKYLGSFSVSLEKLMAHLTSFTLGIRLKGELSASRKTITEALELIDKLRTSSLYHLALLQKEFTDLRKKLMDAISLVDALNTEYAGHKDGASADLLATPDSRQAAQDQALADKVRDAVTNKIVPLIADLKKVVEHKSIQARLAEKKKKYAPKVAGSRAGASGGWHSSANDYFDSGYGGSYGGYGGFRDDYYGGSSGGGYSWDDGGYGGGYSNYGGYDNYSSSGGSHSSDYGSSTKSTSSTPAPKTVYGGSRANYPSTFNFNEDYESNPAPHTAPAGGYQEPSLPADVTPKEDVVDLLKRVPTNLKKWHAHYKTARTSREKTAEAKKLLESPGFAADVERLSRLTELYPDVQDELTDGQRESFYEFLDTLSEYVPMLVTAATYASPPYAKLFEEKRIVNEQGVSARKARKLAQNAQLQRQRSYRALMQWIYAMRNNRRSQKRLFTLIGDELLKLALPVLKKIKVFAELLEEAVPLTLEETMQLNTLSRQIFHEPIALSYPEPDAENDGAASPQKGTLALLREEQKATETLVWPIVETQYALFHEIVLILQEATAETQRELGTTSEDDEEEPLDLDDPHVMHTFSRKIQYILSTTRDSHPQKQLLSEMLLPCDQNKFQKYEVQHTLLEELVRQWRPLPTQTAEAATNEKDLAVLANDSSVTDVSLPEKASTSEPILIQTEVG